MRRAKRRLRWLWLSAVAALAGPVPAAAFSFAQVAADLSLSPDESARLAQGNAVTRTLSASTERELAVGLIIRIQAPTPTVAKDLLDGLMLQANPNVVARAPITTGAIEEFAGVHLPDAATANAYLGARAGEALNLSTAEIAAFRALAQQPAAASNPIAAVEPLLHQQLQTRYRAYLEAGLAGIPPYARGSREERPGDDLIAATRASKLFNKYAPRMVQVLTDYPKTRPADLSERDRWLVIRAHGTPTIVLAHYLSLPDGDAFSVSSTQYYVSGTYNAEKNLGLLIPTDDGATIGIELSRVSTDQVAGFGGSAKRSIGSRLMADTLAGIAQRAAGKIGTR